VIFYQLNNPFFNLFHFPIPLFPLWEHLQVLDLFHFHGGDGLSLISRFRLGRRPCVNPTQLISPEIICPWVG